MNNLFLRDESYYQRDLDPLRQYVDQSAFYLSRVKGIPYDVARQKIKTKIQNKEFAGQKDPMVKFYERHNYEDKEVTFVPLSQYLATMVTENLTNAPSMTCYVHTSERPSLLSGFTDQNVKVRNIAKKEAAKQKALGDMPKHYYFQNVQDNAKLYNNAMSGAFSSEGSVIRNPTAHSSLTSTVRTMTSIGNASNERLIMGNRHYRNANITLNNVVVLAHSANSAEIKETLVKYNLKPPSVEDVMACIRYSTKLYWQDLRQMQLIEDFVRTLTVEERASIVYTGDLYQLRQLNPEAIRVFISRLGTKIKDRTYADPITEIRNTDEMYVNYVHQICMEEVVGINKDYTMISKEKQDIVAGTCNNIKEVLADYEGLIKAFFLTPNLPCSVAYIRDSIRRSVVLSDTDSTMFSCDDWVKWYYGSINFEDEAFGIAGGVMFMATQCIAHNLAIYSANLNVERKKLWMAAMKPEYVFPIFALTSAGKHYYTYIRVKEGSVYKKLEMEIKGVHLKNSASPKPIIKDVRAMMTNILDNVLAGKKISLTHWVNHVATVEKEIRRSVLAGETTYLGRLNIQGPEAYKVGPEQSNYRHHLFWNEIFAPKYGAAPEPTYSSVKFPTTLNSRRLLGIWMTQIQDEALRARIAAFLERTGRTDLNTLYVAQDLIDANGLPSEIISAINIDALILQHTGAYRLILESIGFFGKFEHTLIQQGY